ncbi:MAG: aspartate kinase [Candidatus Omnitrophica bacterium]|nr:aspartate kinase [Candidatus Omnitrophota bacterium]
MTNLVVQKYGGTSVADPQKIMSVANRVMKRVRKGSQVVVVVSALGDTTDRLLELAAEITDSPSERELAVLMSTGEQISVALLAMAIEKLGGSAISFTGMQVGIRTQGSHTRARIQEISTSTVLKALKAGKVVIVAGFQGVDTELNVTTLGRGGSDLTAVAMAAVLKAPVCEIYTDVDGVYTADPRICPDARKLDAISSDEMFEMASLGSQVLQTRSVELAKKAGVEIHVRSSFLDKEGTVIVNQADALEGVVVTGVTCNKNEAKVSVLDVPDRPGIAAKLFKMLGAAEINVDMIIQNISRTGHTDITFTVPQEDVKRTLEVVEPEAKKIGFAGVQADKNVAKVSVVGAGMRSSAGVAATMFEALAKAKVNIEMISTSEIKISCVVRQEKADKAVKALHDAFQLGKKRQTSSKVSKKKPSGKRS